MKKQFIKIGAIPAIVWGNASDRVYLFVHGKLSCKEAAEDFAAIAEKKGFQVISFDLPSHGERKSDAERCDIWNGIRDLRIVSEYVFARWAHVLLYGCSLGAFFALHAYADMAFEKCLFQSPIVDMVYLIQQMMVWFGVSEERLAREGEVDTPIDILSQKYYEYVLEHPIEKWGFPTEILYGSRDTLQSREVLECFAARFGCRLVVAEGCDHPFMADAERLVVDSWLRESI